MNSIFHRISVGKYEDRPVETEKIMEKLQTIMDFPFHSHQMKSRRMYTQIQLIFI